MNKILKTNLALMTLSGLNISFFSLSSCTINKIIEINKVDFKINNDDHCEIISSPDHLTNDQDCVVGIKYLDNYILDNIKVTINNKEVSQNVAYTFNDDQTKLTIFNRYITGNVSIDIKTKKNYFIKPEIEQTFLANFYISNLNTWEWMQSNNAKPINVTFFKQAPSHVPYISVGEMFDYYQSSSHYECINEKENITKINNKLTNATAVVDAKQQKIIFSDWDKFFFIPQNKTNINNPLAVVIDNGDNYLLDPVDSTYQTINKPYEIDLKKYNINIFYYQNTCYLPYDLYFGILLGIYVSSDYIFNGHDFYEKQSGELYEFYKKLDVKWIDQQYLEYNYNLLALKIDNLYGMRERLARTNNYQPIKYLPDGAYAALEPYKTGLTSLEPNKANKTLINFITENLDDGGHTAYSNKIDLLSTINLPRQIGPESVYISYVVNDIQNARKRVKLAPDDIITNIPIIYIFNLQLEINAYCQEYVNPNDNNDIILYIVFDEFSLPILNNDGTSLLLNGSVNYADVNDTNYYFDTIRLTMYTDKLIRKYKNENKKVSLVVDLSNNHGGVGFIEYFIASWLCGGVKQTLENTHTKSFSNFIVHADINSDGKFDENDYLPDDVKVYCITSNATFSCGNLLSVNLMENKKDNMFFIGEPTGGGACNPLIMSTAISGDLHYSGNFHLLMNSSTFDNRLSMDVGTKDATFFYPISSDHPLAFFDRDTINEKIWNNK